MKKIVKVWGPYLYKNSVRKYVCVKYEDGTKKSTALARHLLEVHLGRELEGDETADHINEDPGDDRIENLQVLRLIPNVLKSLAHRNIHTPKGTYECARCGISFERSLSIVRGHEKEGRHRQFCTLSCGAKFRVESKEEHVDCICANCQITFQKFFAHVKNPVQFCSETCKKQFKQKVPNL